jgi:hypothetical protein
VEGTLRLTAADNTVLLWELSTSSKGAYMHIDNSGTVGLYAAQQHSATPVLSLVPLATLQQQFVGVDKQSKLFGTTYSDQHGKSISTVPQCSSN